MTNREKLRKLIKKHAMTIKQVAAILEVRPDTVISWLRPDTSKSRRKMPNVQMRMLELLLQEEGHSRKAIRR